MQVDTGHLVNTDGMSQSQLKRLASQGYEEVPDELRNSAKLELAGRKETHVGLKSTGSN